MSDPVLEFRDILECAGLVPGEISADGYLHRCGIIGKERGRDGAYVFHPDPPASGWWQNFRTGQEDTWTVRSNLKLTSEEHHKLDVRTNLDKSKRKAEETLRYANGRNIAEYIVNVCPPATSPQNYRAHLLSFGLHLAPGNKGNNRLHMLLSLARPEARARCASRIGWLGARFVLPEGTIGNDQGEEINFSASA